MCMHMSIQRELVVLKGEKNRSKPKSVHLESIQIGLNEHI